MLEISKGVHPRQRNHKNMPVSAGIKPRRHPMQKRIQASMQTRQALSSLIEGRLSSPDARADLIKLATRLIVEEALEAESRDALGREYYEHGAEPGQGYRNGHRPGRLKTAEGFIEYAAPSDSRARGRVPLGYPGQPQGAHRGARRVGGGAFGARLVGARHRRRLHRRERSSAALAHGGLGTR